mgnify:CR=1 FL=1
MVSMALEYSEGMDLAVFSRVLLELLYLVKKGVIAIGKKAVETAVNVGHDVLEGKSVKQAVTSRGRQAVNDLAKQGVNNIRRQVGGGSKRKQKNQTGRLKTGSQKKVVTSTQASKRRTSPLDTQENIFGSLPTKKWRKQ